MNKEKIIEELKEIVGPDNASDEPWVLYIYSKDSSISEGQVPSFVVRPKTVEEVQDIVRLANRTMTPVFPRGSGNALWGAVPPKGSIVIDMARMNRLSKINKDCLNCVVEPGIMWAELEGLLHKEGYKYLVAPGNYIGASVGGHISSHGVGPGSSIAGNQGDCVIGLKVVLADGTLLTTGSAAHPNHPEHFARFTFPFDLTGLFIGSEGTLGIFVEISLKIEKLEDAVRFGVYAFKTYEEGCKAALEFRETQFRLVRLMIDKYISGRRARYSAEAEKLVSTTHPITIIMGFEVCHEDLADPQLKVIQEIAKRNDGVDLSTLDPSVPVNAENMWRETGIGHTLRFQHGVRTLLPMIIPFGTEAQFFFEKGLEITEEAKEKFPEFVYSDAGNAFSVDRHYLSGFMTWYNESDPENWNRARQAMEFFQENAWKYGWTPYRWGTEWSEYLKTMHPYHDVLKKLKETLDPNNIMSPGILGLGEEEVR